MGGYRFSLSQSQDTARLSVLLRLGPFALKHICERATLSLSPFIKTKSLSHHVSALTGGAHGKLSCSLFEQLVFCLSGFHSSASYHTDTETHLGREYNFVLEW
jgi:hypothetical protein